MGDKFVLYVPGSDQLYEYLPRTVNQRKPGVHYFVQDYSRDHRIVMRDNKFGLIDKVRIRPVQDTN